MAGRELEWRLVESGSDVVELGQRGGRNDFVVAYAWADLEVPERTRALLGLGSDDALKVWLNGTLVHENWASRGARPDDDVVPVELRKGHNRLLLKVQNRQRSWGLVCRLMGPSARTQRLVGGARGGDIHTVTRLLDHGVEVDGRDRTGLTAARAARLAGRREVVELLASRGADTTAPLPPPAQSVDALFGSVLQGRSPGATVLVAQDGRIQLERGYGLADVEGRVPVTAGTRFRIGSLTKQFTAAAILRLQEQGKLSVQDKLSKFIPDYPRGDEVTLHHLLSHTSGIHSYTNKPGFLETVTTSATPEALIDSFKNDAFDFDPGQKWLYSNSGYFLLGYIVEKASGQSYASYLRQTFFEPLGMRDTGVHVAGVPLEREALGYGFEQGEVKRAPDWNLSRAGGAGSLYSTVGDLYRWDEAVFTGKVLQPANLQTALTPVKVAGDDPAQAKESGYGYGWQIGQMRELQEISHGGGLAGFLSYLLRLPERRFTVAVLVNCAPPPPGIDPGRMANEIAELYLGETLLPRKAPQAVATPSAQAR